MEKKLKELNFNKLLIIDTNINSYNFDVYMNNQGHKIKGFCTDCEQKGFNLCPTDKNFKLQNISHGASTEDFIRATKQHKLDRSDWKEEGVFFLMEGPSIDYNIYINKVSNGYKKKPAKEWYWIHKIQEKYMYPEEFSGGRYGTLINSIIFTFKLKNAYISNFVKCGLNNENNNFKGIQEYDERCLKNCFDNFLIREMEILRPKIVFCFGSNVENKLYEIYPNDYPFRVCVLPHPAGRRRGFKNDYYRHLYFTRILEGLYLAGIITREAAKNKFGEFLSRSGEES